MRGAEPSAMSVLRKTGTLLRVARRGDWPDLRRRLLKNLHLISDADLSATFWDAMDSVPGQHWRDLPMVMERRTRLLTGDATRSVETYITERYLSPKKPASAISLACGAGSWEREWMRHYAFQRIYGLDISPASIDQARHAAAAAGLMGVDYDVADLNRLVLPEQSYDVVLTNAGVHHVENLENLFAQIRKTLRPGGMFVMHDFVGPTRFQWTDRQLDAINGLLAILPRKYRISVTTGMEKRRVDRPDQSYMKQTDPSEAVRSSDIVPLFKHHFRVLEWKNEGGAVLHMLLNDLAGNFKNTSPEDRAWLELCFAVEDMLMESGEVESDFVLAVGA